MEDFLWLNDTHLVLLPREMISTWTNGPSLIYRHMHPHWVLCDEDAADIFVQFFCDSFILTKVENNV